jgi:hypothetical protein
MCRRAERTNDNAPSHRVIASRRDSPTQSKCWRGPRCRGHVGRTDISADPSRQTRRVTCPWVVAPIGGRAGPNATPGLRAGSVKIDTRAQAVHPTATAPSMANDSRHHPWGIPNCAMARAHRTQREPPESRTAANEAADNGRARDGEGVPPEHECETTRSKGDDDGPLTDLLGFDRHKSRQSRRCRTATPGLRARKLPNRRHRAQRH